MSVIVELHVRRVGGVVLKRMGLNLMSVREWICLCLRSECIWV